MQHYAALFPLRGQLVYSHRVEKHAVTRIQLYADGWCAGNVANLRAEIVSVALLDPHTAKTFIRHAEQIRPFGFNAQIMGIGGVEGIVVVNAQCAARLAWTEFAPPHHRVRKFKATILN